MSIHILGNKFLLEDRIGTWGCHIWTQLLILNSPSHHAPTPGCFRSRFGDNLKALEFLHEITVQNVERDGLVCIIKRHLLLRCEYFPIRAVSFFVPKRKQQFSKQFGYILE